MDLLLAIQKDRAIRQLRLDRPASSSLTKTLVALTNAYLDGVELHDYAPAFRPDHGGLVHVDFTLPDALRKCGRSTPSSLAAIDAELAITTPLAALVGVEQGATPRFVFQALDSSTLLKKGRALFFNPGGFTVNSRPGILVRSRVDAVHVGGKLYFSSEQVVRRFLDIDYLFREATEEEITELFNGKAFDVDDWPAVRESANSVLRRKLHIVHTSGKSIDPVAVRQLAERFGLKLEVRNNRLVVPTDPPAFREFVRVLAHEYLESPLDQELYLATSKRPARKVK